MKQYPFFLFATDIIGGNNDNEGRAIQGTPNYQACGPCREETRSGQRKLYLGGEEYDFTSFILCPTTCPDIKEGSVVEMRDSLGNVLLEKTVILFRRKQLHTRIWV